MRSLIFRCLSKIIGKPSVFATDARGGVAVTFALSATVIMLAAGAAMDLMRAYQAEQKLYETATLACQYSSRPSVIQTDASSYSGSNGVSTYASKVQTFISATLQTENFPYPQTTSAPFSSTQNGPANITLSASVPTTFMQILHVTQLPISTTVHCYSSSASIPEIVNPPYIVQETFGNSGCTTQCGWYMYAASGAALNLGNGKTLSTPNSVATSSVGYTGATGTQWVIMGYCLEVDTVGASIWSSVPVGTHTAELDCDNGSGSAGNSSISTMQYLEAGNHEVRYFYNGRVDYPDYDNAYICGSTASDLSWANSTNSSGGPVSNAYRTNQINVYLDLNTTGVPPTHTTLDGSQQLGGANLIDECVYSPQTWVERSVRVYIQTPGWYWLSFAADGQNDSYGGSVADLRLCQGTCPGTPQENFPTPWATSTNLFQDTFESPTYGYSTWGSTAYTNTSGNMSNSDGTFGAGAGGWPNTTASGWGAAPWNGINYVMKSPAQGSQAIELAGTSGSSASRLISRGFLLDPGYYQVSYNYISDAHFSSLTNVYCGATPSAANVSALSGTGSATSRVTGSAGTVALNSSMVGLFMSHALEASTPVVGGSLNSATSYNNPDGTTTSTAKSPPNSISLTSYNSSQANPLLDICGYASSWQSRTATIQISKPAYYWLTASALGTTTSEFAGAIDNVQITALGGLSMTSPPSNPIAIPVPSPQPGSTMTSYSGFEYVADPLILPAPNL